MNCSHLPGKHPWFLLDGTLLGLLSKLKVVTLHIPLHTQYRICGLVGRASAFFGDDVGSTPTCCALVVWLWTFGSRTAWLVNKSAGQAPVLGAWLSQPGQISLLTGIETGWPQIFLICWRGCHVYPHLDWAPALSILKLVECSNCIGNKAVLALLACNLVPSRQYS